MSQLDAMREQKTLDDLLRHTDTARRRSGAWLLAGWYKNKSLVSLTEATVEDALIAALGQDQDSETREAIVYSLGECIGTIKAMRVIVNTMQGDPSPHVRLRAAQAGMCWLPSERDDPVEWKTTLVQCKELFLRALDHMQQSDPQLELREYATHEYGPAAEELNRDRLT